MTSSQMIARTIEAIPENKLIFASRLYEDKLCEQVTESAYYKTLERFCKAGELCKAAKGTYYRPRKSKYGIVPISEAEIIRAFTEEESGTVVGYSLYNRLKLTTQVGKTVEVYSSQLEQQTKKINNIFLNYCNLVFTPSTEEVIHMMEVLQHFGEIQELNYGSFLSYCKEFSSNFDNESFDYVSRQLRYQKRTISFLHTILNHFGVKNTLGKYLSSLSEYKHPSMEELYEAAYVSG